MQTKINLMWLYGLFTIKNSIEPKDFESRTKRNECKQHSQSNPNRMWVVNPYGARALSLSSSLPHTLSFVLLSLCMYKCMIHSKTSTRVRRSQFSTVRDLIEMYIYKNSHLWFFNCVRCFMCCDQKKGKKRQRIFLVFCRVRNFFLSRLSWPCFQFLVCINDFEWKVIFFCCCLICKWLNWKIPQNYRNNRQRTVNKRDERN